MKTRRSLSMDLTRAEQRTAVMELALVNGKAEK